LGRIVPVAETHSGLLPATLRQVLPRLSSPREGALMGFLRFGSPASSPFTLLEPVRTPLQTHESAGDNSPHSPGTHHGPRRGFPSILPGSVRLRCGRV